MRYPNRFLSAALLAAAWASPGLAQLTNPGFLRTQGGGPLGSGGGLRSQGGGPLRGMNGGLRSQGGGPLRGVTGSYQPGHAPGMGTGFVTQGWVGGNTAGGVFVPNQFGFDTTGAGTVLGQPGEFVPNGVAVFGTGVPSPFAATVPPAFRPDPRAVTQVVGGYPVVIGRTVGTIHPPRWTAGPPLMNNTGGVAFPANANLNAFGNPTTGGIPAGFSASPSGGRMPGTTVGVISPGGR